MKTAAIIILIVIGAIMVSRQFLKINGEYLEINGVKLSIEVADIPSEQTKGLSGRLSLCEKCGMLFVFSESMRHSFWMKEMFIPLDFVWMNKGRVVETTENVKPEDYQPPNSFSSKYPADTVLEVNAGIVKKFNIKIGDAINWK